MWFSRVVGELSGYDVVVGEKGVDENEGEEEWKRIGVMEAEPPKLSLVLKWLLCSLIILLCLSHLDISRMTILA